MKKLLPLSLSLIPGLAFLTGTAAAQSTTQTPGPTDSANNYGSLVPARYRSPFLTRTARNVGDVVTIIVSEASASSFSASTDATKKDNSSTGPNSVPLLDFLRVGLLNTLLKPGQTQANSTVSGTGSTQAQGKFTARLSAIVKQVMPNGTLLIEGSRLVKVNKETQTLVLSGLVRPDDIRSDNTVLSESIAGAEIKSEGIGLIVDRQRRGLLTRLVDWLF